MRKQSSFTRTGTDQGWSSDLKSMGGDFEDPKRDIVSVSDLEMGSTDAETAFRKGRELRMKDHRKTSCRQAIKGRKKLYREAFVRGWEWQERRFARR